MAVISSVDLIEAVLALCLLIAALICLFDRHLVRACRAFFAFTLTMALAWLTLGMPWLAAVEGLLGTVLTVACFFYALGIFPSSASKLPRYDHFEPPLTHRVTRIVLALAWCLMVGAAIFLVLPEMAYSPAKHPLVLAGVAVVATAMGAFAWQRHLLRRLLAFNVLGSGVFLLLAGVAGAIPQGQALVIVGLVIAWLGSLLGALVIRKLYQLEGQEALLEDDGREEKAK